MCIVSPGFKGLCFCIAKVESGVSLFTINKMKVIPEHIHTASKYFSLLLSSTKADEKGAYRDLIIECMGDSTLSNWFSLYVRTIFFHVHDADNHQQDVFLMAIKNCHVDALKREVRGQKRLLSIQLARVNSEQRSLMSRSFHNLTAIQAEEALIQSKSQQFSEQLSLFRDNTLAIFLLMSNMLVIIEQQDTVFPMMSLSAMKKTLSEPFGFMVKMAPVLRALLTLFRQEPVEYTTTDLDGAIAMTLQLVGFVGDDGAMLVLVRDELFKQNHLSHADDGLDEESDRSSTICAV